MSQPACPNCDLALHAITARARSGYLLPLDQCRRCGGLWFDRWELFPLDAVEVARLDPVDRAALWAPVADVKRMLKCPRCRRTLDRFRDVLLPEDTRIERCKACDGMWLNRGELRRFKQARGGKRAEGITQQLRQPPLSDETIQTVAERYGDAAQWPTVTRLDGATTAPPLDEEPAGIQSELARAGGWLGVRFLLRLLLGV